MVMPITKEAIMYTYTVNIARCFPDGAKDAYRFWGRVDLGDCNESEARSKFDRIIAAFPAPHWSCLLNQHAQPDTRTLDAT